jgi:hypothetical protein
VLLTELVPDFDFRSRHEIEVAAPPTRVSEAVERYRPDRGALLARFLVRVRGLDLPRGTLRESFAASGFTLLAEDPGEEVVFGIAGRFWALREKANLDTPADAIAFKTFARPGQAKAALNLRIEAAPGGGTRLSTETRVRCSDRAARWRFGAYWAFIRPFAGFLRRAMLRGIKREAEGLGDLHPRREARQDPGGPGPR